MTVAAPNFLQCCKVLQCCAPYLQHHCPPFRGGASAARRCRHDRRCGMNSDRVLLFELRERTSAAGNRYLSGWLGKASVVAFLDRDADEPTWQVFLSTPTPKPIGGEVPRPDRSPFTPRQRRPRRSVSPLAAGELDDAIDALGTLPERHHK